MVSIGAAGTARACGVRVGFFGKLPSRGDFVRAGLSRPAVAACDRWLSSVPHLPTASLIPPWRFAFAPGVCGPAVLTGIVLPSRDRVGRAFPLLVAAEAAEPGEDFLDAAERIGTAAITAALTPAMLMDQLHATPWPGPAEPDPAKPGPGPAARWWRKGGEMAAFARDTDALMRTLPP